MTSCRCPHCKGEIQLVRAGARVAPSANGVETLDQWVERWWSLARRTARPAEERRCYEQWIRPALGALPVAIVLRADIESWVVGIDRDVAARRIRASTAIRIWGIVAKIFRDASSSKVRALRVREDNPTRGVQRPDGSPARAATFLYPSEFLRLMRCRRVPLVFRRLYALTIYLYPRAGEVRALDWSDVDVRSGHVHVHRSESRRGVVGRTKSRADRQFVAERSLTPLLRAMRHAAKGTGRLFPRIPQRQNLARVLRQHLTWAGCDRADIHASDDGRRPLTYHDLRATGITWMAMRGDSPADIMERVGHAQLATTERYIRRGRLMARARGERTFPPLPPTLLRKR